MRRIIIIFLLSLCVGAALAQSAPVYFKVANEGDVISTQGFVTFRYGVGTCWSPKLTITLSTFTWSLNNYLHIISNPANVDPCPNQVKEVDVLETALPQTVFVNGTTVVVPALGGIPIVFNGTKYMCATISVDSTGTLTLTSCK